MQFKQLFLISIFIFSIAAHANPAVEAIKIDKYDLEKPDTLNNPFLIHLGTKFIEKQVYSENEGFFFELEVDSVNFKIATIYQSRESGEAKKIIVKSEVISSGCNWNGCGSFTYNCSLNFIFDMVLNLWTLPTESNQQACKIISEF